MSRTDGHDEDADLDGVDRYLLAGLLADGRAGPSELAEGAGIATSTATKRVQRLEERGVVRGYRPEVDYAAFGYDVSAVFQVDVAAGRVDGVMADLRATGRMVAVYQVTGPTDVLAIGHFESTDAMDATVTDLLAHDGVSDVRTNVVLDTVVAYDPPPVPRE